METYIEKSSKYEKLSSFPLEFFPLKMMITGAEVVRTKLGEQLLIYRDRDGLPPISSSSMSLIRQVKLWQDKFREIALAEIVIHKEPHVYNGLPTFKYYIDNDVKVLEYRSKSEKMTFRWTV